MSGKFKLTAAGSIGKSRPLVSVITPTFNYGALIGETLDSLRRQTLADWECVVVDDGSTDDTAEVVARFARDDARFRYVRQANRRQAAAKNAGLAATAGRYVQFLDADDLIEPRKFERQVEYLERHPEVDILYGGVRYFRTDRPGERLRSMCGEDRPWMPETSGRGRDVLSALVENNIMVINAPLVRRGVIESVGPFDERLPPAEDWDYWVRCAAAGAHFRHEDLAGTLALVRAHPLSSSQDRRRMYRSVLLLRKKVGALTSDPVILARNAELAIEEQESLAAEEILHGSLAGRLGQMLKAAAVNRNARHKAKWFVCALAAPFVSRQRLRTLITSPLAGSLTPGRKKPGAPAHGPRD